MKKYAELPLKEYIIDLSAKMDAPGGGSAAGLVGALSAALASMVANFTIGKKKYAEVEDEIKDVLNKTETIKNEFLSLMQEDIETFHNEMGAAYSLPTNTDEEKSKRRDAIEQACKKCAEVPLKIAQKCEEMVSYLEILEQKGNKLLISDIGVSAVLLKATFESALFNIRVNLKYISDREFVNSTEKTIQELISKVLPKCTSLIQSVEEKLEN